jgi:cysteine-rich repeat protein
VIQDEIEQCEDLKMVDDDACTNLCLDASCGDGILWANMEVCNDGNLDDDDMCRGSCEPAFCRGGYTLNGAEQCDDGNEIDNDGCTNNCISLSKKVFVSSQMYDGNLGGLAGADAKCQALADAANLTGTYMAWISTNQHDRAWRPGPDRKHQLGGVVAGRAPEQQTRKLAHAARSRQAQ